MPLLLSISAANYTKLYTNLMLCMDRKVWQVQLNYFFNIKTKIVEFLTNSKWVEKEAVPHKRTQMNVYQQPNSRLGSNKENKPNWR